MNAKKCKAMRRIIGRIWSEVVYHVPPLEKLEVHHHHHKTVTVTLGNCGHRMYHLMKKAYKKSTSAQGAYA